MIHTQERSRAKLEQEIRTALYTKSPRLKMELIGTSSKMLLGRGLDYLCGVVHLQPHNSGGFGTLCPMSTPQCREACLVNSGRMVGKQARDGRQWKTELYQRHPSLWRELMSFELRRFSNLARKQGLGCSVRMDGTSDTGEAENWTDECRKLEIKQYEYTKVFSRAIKRPWLYTFSYSGTGINHTQALLILEQKGNVAVVFGIGKKDPLPKEWNGFEVIDGDKHDLRFLDPLGVVVGLRVKGTKQIKAMTNKFIQEVTQ